MRPKGGGGAAGGPSWGLGWPVGPSRPSVGLGGGLRGLFLALCEPWGGFRGLPGPLRALRATYGPVGARSTLSARGKGGTRGWGEALPAPCGR